MYMSDSQSTRNISLLKQLQNNWFWWIIYALILGVALFLRLETYDRYLPFIDYTDESVYVELAQHNRGLTNASGVFDAYGEGLAPMYVAYNQLVQEIVDLFKPHDWNIPLDYYEPIRLLNVFWGVFTVVGLFWLGYLLTGHGGAILTPVMDKQELGNHP